MMLPKNKEKQFLIGKKEHPEWSKTDKGKDEYIALVKSVMTDITNEKNENKIIKTIRKETIIK